MKIEDTHWSTTLAADLSARFAPQLDDTINIQFNQLLTRLGEALDAGHTVVHLSAAELAWWQVHTHPLVGIISQDDAHTYTYTCAHIKKPIIIYTFGQQALAYLHRQWHQESRLAEKIHALAGRMQAVAAQVDLSHLPESMNDKQRAAIHAAMHGYFTLITGGPGTGKTWTVAQLVLTLLKARPKMQIALAAPTGKAAQRMQEALDNALRDSLTDDAFTQIKSQIDSAKTIHRLLGLGFGTKPRFHAGAPLPYELVVVDEASMLGVALAGQLMQAVGAHTQLILLGDANQLAAVEAGAVLADLCASAALTKQHVNLTQSRRFTADSGIGHLAKAVLENQPNRADELLTRLDDIVKIDPASLNNSLYNTLWQPFLAFSEQVAQLHGKPSSAISAQVVTKLFKTFDDYRILTATHGGKLGGERVNAELSVLHQRKLGLLKSGLAWFHGRPVMLTKNDYQLKLANGDIGIALRDSSGNFQVYFPALTQPIAANRLSENHITTAFALTIHKSQGSEFTQVAILLDKPNQTNDNPVNFLSRELLYTAITRAKKSVHIYADTPTLHHAIETKAIRQTGLGIFSYYA